MAKSKKSKDEDEVKSKKKKAKAEKEKPSKKSKKAKDDLDEDDTKKKKKVFDINAFVGDTLDEVEKRQGVESSGLDVPPPTTTGLLCVDLMMGGGIRPSMLTAAGNEQCAKTTLAFTAMGAAIKSNIPFIAFWDYEGSSKSSKPYVHSILKGMGINMTMDQIFGKRNKDGKWEIRPRVRFRAETILEKFYTWLGDNLRKLPDKRFVENKWWYVFEDNKKNKAKVSDYIDSTMTRKYGNGLWVEAPDGQMQGIVFLDSYTAMMPESKDEEEISNQLSVKASAFSKQLERIKGRMAQKMVTVYGLNHLRDNPMAMFGPKETEKGGKALQQFSDVRLRQTSRSNSASPFKAGLVQSKKNYNEMEKSVEFAGRDYYRYVHIKAIKNKLWTPERECFIRIWVEDGSGTARGIDPVFDTMYYLKQTGQLSGPRKKMKIKLEGLGKAKKPVDWATMKLWILGKKEDKVKVSKSLGFDPMDLRKFCFKQLDKGVAEDLFIAAETDKVNSGRDDDDDDDE